MRQNPQKLLELYDETYYWSLKSRAEEEQTLINNALRMLLCLQVPLRTADFIFALCSCEDASLAAEDLVDLCSSFVAVDTELDIFRFAHLSVREFLETKDDYKPDRNHALVAELCLRYLSSSIVTQTGNWKNQHAGSEFDPSKSGASSWVLVHRHPSKAPMAIKVPAYAINCHSCGHRMQGTSWYCRSLQGSGQDFCGDCVERGIVCEHEDRCPLLTSPGYGNNEDLVKKETLDDGNEETPLEAPVSTLSTVPIFLNGFHQYSCLYWPFHLKWSMNPQLSNRLQAVSLDFMIDGQKRASASFASWSNIILNTRHFPFKDYTWGYDLRAGATLDPGVSQPADCVFIAAIWEFCDMLEMRANIDPETVNTVTQLDGFTALHLASAYGKARAAQVLLEKGANLEERNCLGYTVLGIAVETQHAEIVSLLLEHGADARKEQQYGYPLQQAVKLGHLAIIHLLLKYGAAPEDGGMIDDPVLSLAAATGNEEAMKLLLDSFKSTDSSTKALWKMVTRIQRLMRTEGEAGLLQSLGTWPKSTIANQFLGTVLWRAVERQDEASARLLLARGADPNTVCENKTVFRVALRPLFKGNIEQLKFLKMLLAHGATPDIRRNGKSGIEMLMAWGIHFDIIDLVRLCVDSGADLNRACSSLYRDPLFCAVENRNVEIVRFLLQRGANPQEVSAQFFSGRIKPRDSGKHSLEDSKKIGELLSAHESTFGLQSG